jgi:hypothetical protein
MKLFGAIKLWMPLAIFGAAFLLAPQSRAQAEVSPDHFDDNGVTGNFVHANSASKTTAVKSASTAVAHNQKPSAKAKTQTVAKNSPAAPKEQLVAVNDKSKVPPRKQNDQK